MPRGRPQRLARGGPGGVFRSYSLFLRPQDQTRGVTGGVFRSCTLFLRPRGQSKIGFWRSFSHLHTFSPPKGQRNGPGVILATVVTYRGRRDSGKWEYRRHSSLLDKAFQRAEGAGIQENGNTGATALFLTRHFKGQKAPGFRKMGIPAPQLSS